jgi:hypothetical protein
MLLVMSATLIGCAEAESKAPEDEAQAANTAESDTEPETAPFSFSYEDVQIVPGEKMSELRGKIGEPGDIFEAPSCAFEGVDRIYYYPGFLINTYPDGDEELILSVVFQDDTIKTGEGLYLGMSADEVAAIYGEGASNDEGNAVVFQSGDEELRVLFDGGAVIDIALCYLPAQEQVESANAAL